MPVARPGALVRLLRPCVSFLLLQRRSDTESIMNGIGHDSTEDDHEQTRVPLSEVEESWDGKVQESEDLDGAGHAG